MVAYSLIRHSCVCVCTCMCGHIKITLNLCFRNTLTRCVLCVMLVHFHGIQCKISVCMCRVNPSHRTTSFFASCLSFVFGSYQLFSSDLMQCITHGCELKSATVLWNNRTCDLCSETCCLSFFCPIPLCLPQSLLSSNCEGTLGVCLSEPPCKLKQDECWLSNNSVKWLQWHHSHTKTQITRAEQDAGICL